MQGKQAYIIFLSDEDGKKLVIPEISHTQAQIFIGAIGIYKGLDIFYPAKDRARTKLPYFNKDVQHIIEEIDYIWLDSTKIVSQNEHLTPFGATVV